MKLHETNLLSVNDLSNEEVRRILYGAIHIFDDLPLYARPAVVGMFFEEPSTRTRLSFEIAARKLKFHIVDLNVGQLSLKKGESWEDTLKTWESMLDVFVYRSPASVIPDMPNTFIINAGNYYEHPTQALADLLTLKQEFGEDVKGLNIALVGDIYLDTQRQLYVRTVQSFKELVKRMGANVDFEMISGNLNSLPSNIDVVYLVRPLFLWQSKEFNDVKVVRDNYPSVTSSYSHRAKIMHPLPRNVEIDTNFDWDERALYWKQVRNLIPVRMSVLNFAARQMFL